MKCSGDIRRQSSCRQGPSTAPVFLYKEAAVAAAVPVLIQQIEEVIIPLFAIPLVLYFPPLLFVFFPFNALNFVDILYYD